MKIHFCFSIKVMRYAPFHWVLLLFILPAFSCNVLPPSLVQDPHHLQDVKAVVHLENDAAVTGYMSLNIARNRHSLQVRSSNGRSKTDIPLHAVVGYTVEEEHFLYKTLHPPSHAIVIPAEQPFKAFVKKITPPEYAISVFRYTQWVPEIKSPLKKPVHHYFVELPVDIGHALHPIQSEYFAKTFTEKLAASFPACTLLNKKIQSGEKGLQLKKMTADRLAVVMKVATLYNDCLTAVYNDSKGGK
jgi:hypothetical protein